MVNWFRICLLGIVLTNVWSSQSDSCALGQQESAKDSAKQTGSSDAKPDAGAAPSKATEAPTTDQSKASTPEAPPTAPIQSGLIDFDRDIRPIFEAKCVECHGPKKATNDFRVDQQDTLLPYAEGGLESSLLWTTYLMTDDQDMKMPPVKQDNPLTGAELALIKVWIEEGAQWKDPAEPAAENDSATEPQASTTATATSDSAPAVESTLQEKLWTFQGYFHPAMVHFPVACLMMAALFGIGAIFFGETCELVAFHCLWVGAMGAVASCLMGWSFADICGYGADPWAFDWNSAVTRHRWSGIVLAVLAMIVWFIAIIARRTESSTLRGVWIVGAISAAALVGIVGHQGGEMTYGEGMYDKAFENLFSQAAPAQENLASPVPASERAASRRP